VELRRREEARRLAAARRRTDELAYHGKTTDTADGRPHREVQTELYLEELTDHVEEMDVACQTDAFLDRPPSPLFIPAKTGLDVMTQVYDGDVRTRTRTRTVLVSLLFYIYQRLKCSGTQKTQFFASTSFWKIIPSIPEASIPPTTKALCPQLSPFPSLPHSSSPPITSSPPRSPYFFSSPFPSCRAP